MKIFGNICLIGTGIGMVYHLPDPISKTIIGLCFILLTVLFNKK